MAAVSEMRARLPVFETKRAAVAVAALSQAGAFEGYASLFNVVDLGRDMVLPGAFRDSLSTRGAAGVKLLWQHDAAQVIGSWLSIAEDGKGLFARGQLNLDVAKAREVYALMKEGAVDGLSIGFRTQKSVTDPATGVRRLQKVDLWEISIVTFPMLPNARVSSVKYLDAKARLAAAIERGTTQIAAHNARRAMDVRLTRAIERGAQSMARKLFNPDQPRDDHGRWTSGGVGAADVSGQAPVAAPPAKPAVKPIQLAMNDTGSMSDVGGILPAQPTGRIGNTPDGTAISDAVLRPGDTVGVDLASDITGFTKHGINQAINREVSPADILDAVVNPLRIIPRDNGTIKYVGQSAVVVLNPAGKVVTVWGQ